MIYQEDKKWKSLSGDCSDLEYPVLLLDVFICGYYGHSQDWRHSMNIDSGNIHVSSSLCQLRISLSQFWSESDEIKPCHYYSWW